MASNTASHSKMPKRQGNTAYVATPSRKRTDPVVQDAAPLKSDSTDDVEEVSIMQEQLHNLLNKFSKLNATAEEASVLRARLEGKEAEVSTHARELWQVRSQLREHEKTIQNERSVSEELRTKLVATQDTLAATQDTLAAAQEYQSRAEELQSSLSDAEIRVGELQSELSSCRTGCDDLQAAHASRVLDLEGQVQSAETRATEAQSHVDRLHQDVEDLRNDCISVDKRAHSLQQQLELSGVEVQAARSRAERAEVTLQSQQADMQEAKTAWNREAEDMKARLLSKEEALQNAEEDCEKYKAALASTEASAKTQLQELEQVEKRAHSLQQQLELSSVEVQAAKSRAERAEVMLQTQQADAQKSEMAWTREIEDLKLRLLSKEEAAQKAEEAVQKAEEDNEKIQAALASSEAYAKTQMQELEKVFQSTCAKLQEAESMVQAQAEELTTTRSALADSEAKHSEVDKRAHNLLQQLELSGVEVQAARSRAERAEVTLQSQEEDIQEVKMAWNHEVEDMKARLLSKEEALQKAEEDCEKYKAALASTQASAETQLQELEQVDKRAHSLQQQLELSSVQVQAAISRAEHAEVTLQSQQAEVQKSEMAWTREIEDLKLRLLSKEETVQKAEEAMQKAEEDSEQIKAALASSEASAKTQLQELEGVYQMTCAKLQEVEAIVQDQAEELATTRSALANAEAKHSEEHANINSDCVSEEAPAAVSEEGADHEVRRSAAAFGFQFDCSVEGEDLRAQNRELALTILQFQQDLEMLEAENAGLQNAMSVFEVDLERHAQNIGHINHKQKIRYTLQLKDQINVLLADLKGARKQIVRLQSGRVAETLVEALTSIGLDINVSLKVPAARVPGRRRSMGGRPGVADDIQERLEEAERKCELHERAFASIGTDFLHLKALVERVVMLYDENDTHRDGVTFAELLQRLRNAIAKANGQSI